MFDNNKTRCPKCLKEIKNGPEDNDYEDSLDIDVYCKDCDIEFKFLMIPKQDIWYETNEEEFAKQFLKLRGYTGEPKSWGCVFNYLERFLEKDYTKEKLWPGENWEEAYQIVCEYFEVEIK